MTHAGGSDPLLGGGIAPGAPYVVPAFGPIEDRPPVVASIPHAGRHIPRQFSQTLTVYEQLLWADWYTDELWRFLPALGVSVVATPLSRFVADPNRNPGSGYGDFWSSVVPATDPMGDPVHSRALAADELEARIAAAHSPFHALLADQLQQVLAVHERAVLIDLHSFGVPLDSDVIIGDVDGTTASPGVVESTAAAFSASSFRVAVNDRFRGGWIVRGASSDERVEALAIEINQRAYLAEDEVNAWPNVPVLDLDRLAITADRLRAVVTELIDALPSTRSNRP